jgi:succinoglycan biosynthesis protein ExoA
VYPYVTVIMPIRNEAEFIHRSLGAVLAQDYPPDRMEIIVIDGMSTDQTREIVQQHISESHRVLVRLLENKGLIAPVGLNLATREARGDIIIRVDGHCIIAPDYVRKCVEHLHNAGVDAVGGPMQTIGNGYIPELTAIAMSSRFGVGNSSFRTESRITKLVDTVPFPAYTREIVDLAGPYDEELVRNQDDEYNYRIRQLGGKILLAGDVHSKYYSRSSLAKMARQYFQYGFYKVRVLQKHPLQMSYRQFVPPAFVLALILSFGFMLLGGGGWPIMLVLGSYLLANLAASLFTAARQGRRYLPLLPLVFALLHLGYGSGFLLGLLRFIRRWNESFVRAPVLSREIKTRPVVPPAD